MSDAAFAVYRRIYDYYKAPFNARVVEVEQAHPYWRTEKVEFDAAYGNERVPAYLYLPTHVQRLHFRRFYGFQAQMPCGSAKAATGDRAAGSSNS